jgi:hypothetical protein
MKQNKDRDSKHTDGVDTETSQRRSTRQSTLSIAIHRRLPRPGVRGIPFELSLIQLR